MLRAAAAEDDPELEAELGKRRGATMLALVSALIILVSIGIIGWVVTRPREQDTPGDPATEEPAADETAHDTSADPTPTQG
jgi:hypothetical protein